MEGILLPKSISPCFFILPSSLERALRSTGRASSAISWRRKRNREVARPRFFSLVRTDQERIFSRIVRLEVWEIFFIRIRFFLRDGLQDVLNQFLVKDAGVGAHVQHPLNIEKERFAGLGGEHAHLQLGAQAGVYRSPKRPPGSTSEMMLRLPQ